jgi:choline-sulfatase
MSPSPSNLIVIMSDEHAPAYMGASGNRFVQTPNLDRLAHRGTNFTNAYTPSPICVPARAAFATGSYVHQTGNWDNALAYDGSVPSWGHVLQRAGIHVESIGKLHYKNDEAPTGFDRQHIPMHIYQGHGMVYGSIRDPLPEVPFDHRMIGDYVGPGESHYNRYDKSISELAIEWLQKRAAEQSEKPWVLFVGFVAPHFPFVAPQEFFDLYPIDRLPKRKLDPAQGYKQHPWIEAQDRIWPHERMFKSEEEKLLAIAAYHALCTYLDTNVGQVLDALEETGLAHNTRVVYTSDHGDNVGARGLWGKSNLYQESVTVPMILAGPEVPVKTVETPVSLIDLFPTILDCVGVHDEIRERKPGQSLFTIESEPDDPDRVVFSEYHAFGAASGAYMVRKGRWKYHYYPGFPPELFNLEDDPQEERDLAADSSYAAKLSEMHAALCAICDPDAVDDAAKRAQAELIENYGGREQARQVGAPGATPAPDH